MELQETVVAMVMVSQIPTECELLAGLSITQLLHLQWDPDPALVRSGEEKRPFWCMHTAGSWEHLCSDSHPSLDSLDVKFKSTAAKELSVSRGHYEAWKD
ncbi:hypothetical protein P7K49_038158 [Saguinus oedipus]|uniref:Uncharacterized protein n=1 Tax=Saguinus oedipus TaxID=9490 RepID=A0ABQ9TDV0_SAGOE|nr:hypothetical protein P7K49_038158 [Saguinus oedipus]